MFTPENYFDKILLVGVQNLSETLQKSHEFVKKSTSNGANWNKYHNNPSIKQMIDTYFTKLYNYVNATPSIAKKLKFSQPTKDTSSRPVKSAATKAAPVPKPKTRTKVSQDDSVNLVEHVDLELKFIKRFVALNGKEKTAKQVLSFINSLQKAIIERHITKSSPYADQIREISEKLINTYNKMKETVTIQLSPETMEEMSKLVKSEQQMLSVQLIKRYIGLQGKSDSKERATNLLLAIKKAFDKNKINGKDKYIDKLLDISTRLKVFIGSKTNKPLEIPTQELNGLYGILSDCGCLELNGIDAPEQSQGKIMSSVDFANMHFDTIGFTGKWLKFFGDPSPNFTIMVYGLPKYGKSYFCVEFAAYLAQNHGRVLYVASEEQLDSTLQKKIKDMNAVNDNLLVSDYLPDDLSGYQFVFLDSVTDMNLSPKELMQLKKDNPNVSFVQIFQTTKAGEFKGDNKYKHNVKMVVEIPEVGYAIQKGRYNQGGEMWFFDNKPVQTTTELNGVKKKATKKKTELYDWSDPEDKSGFLSVDLYALKEIKKYVDKGEYDFAMRMAMQYDTEVREGIPPEVWLRMGGKLTPTGWEKLRADKNKYFED